MKNKKAWLIAAVAGVLAPLGIWAASAQFLSPSTAINCAAGNSCSFNIEAPASAPAAPVAADQNFGASADVTTNWTAGAFSSDLSVGGQLGVTGTTTFTGGVFNQFGARFSPFYAVTMTSGTTTPCAVQNTAGVTRTVFATSYKYTSTTSAGTFFVQAGTSTSAFAAPTTPFVAAAVTTINGRDVITTTSTQMGGSTAVYAPWRANEWLVWQSSTTSNAGTCYVEYY